MPRLEDEAQCELGLQRVSDADAKEAAEIEQCGGAQRVEIIGVVDFGARDDLELVVVEVERSSDAEVEHEEGIYTAARL